MAKRLSLATCALLLSTSTWAHQAKVDTHTQLIPLPAYAQPYGEASAATSLKAATAFLETLNDAQKEQVLFARNASTRQGWSNLPAGIVNRSGISVGELSDEQRSLLFAFLASSLGKTGYENVQKIMAAEAFLSTDQRAARLKWAPENYWISFYGTPSADAPWGWQFGGHHLALNMAVKDNKVETLSPTFVGTEPALFSYNGTKYEVVVDIHKAGYDVFTALDTAQQVKADAGRIPEDVLTGPGQDGSIPPVIGLKASSLNADQKEKLLNTIEKWVSIAPNEHAAPRMAQIAEELDQTSFAWTGNDEVNTPTYMRIQGPSLIIELLSTGGNVGASASGQGHYHTIYRNPNNEYGGQM